MRVPGVVAWSCWHLQVIVQDDQPVVEPDILLPALPAPLERQLTNRLKAVIDSQIEASSPEEAPASSSDVHVQDL